MTASENSCRTSYYSSLLHEKVKQTLVRVK